MRSVLHAIFYYIPFILCGPSIVLTIIAVWIIQKKSPQSMQGYKKYLIAITLATFNFDMGMSILVSPKFLPGAFGTENHGIIALLWPSGGRYQLYYIMTSLILEYILCVIGFSYREYSMIKGKGWRARGYKAFQYIVYFISLGGGAVTFFYQSVPEEEARAYMEQIQANYCRECSIQVIIDADKTIYMTVLAIIGLMTLSSFVGISILRIKRYLAANNSSLSPGTIKLQKMLLKALTWQSFIPFILMVFPLTLEIISFYTVPLVVKNFDTQSLQEDLTALAFLMPSFFSIAHIFYSMRSVLHAIFYYIPFVLCGPSIVLTIIAVWIIQKKSPPSMQGYKKYLIAITLATFNFDMGISILVSPKFLPQAFGTENHGIIAMLWPSGGQYQLYYIMMSFTLEYILCVIGFSYREYSMLKGKTWHARGYKVFQYLVYFTCLAGGTATFFYQSVPEEKARAYMEQIQANYCRECSIQVIIDMEKTIYMAFLSTAGLMTLSSFVGISIIRIKRYLTANSSVLSPSTIKLQKMLLKALTWQSFIPFILMVFPIALEIVSFYTIPLVIKNFEPQALQEDLTAFAFLMPSFFSIAHIFCNFYFTAPYRLYILRRLRPNRCISTVIVAPATMRAVLHAIFHYVPFILCGPSIVLTIIAVWIIQKKSPQSMQGYKKYLIAITLATFNFDMSMSILVCPSFLPGALGTENHGVIALLWPSGGQYQLYYSMMGFILEYILCVIGFSYREYSMLKGKGCYVRSYRAFQYFVYFICLAGGTVTFFYQSVPEEEARDYMEQIQANYCRECSIQVIVDRDKTIYMASLSFVGIIALTSFVGISIIRIRRYLAAKSSSLSPNTIKLQKMLLKALTWQSFIPFILMAFPLALGIISMYAVPLVVQSFEPQSIQEDLTAIAFLMPSFFSIAHIFCNFYFTAPYRLYIIRRLRPTKSTKIVTITPATVELSRLSIR